MNKRLLILSGIAIIAVVANHASLSGFVAMFWWTDQYLPVNVPNYDQIGSFSYYLLVAQQKLALFSVPSFLFVSGVFIAYAIRGSQSRLNWSMIKNRVINLFPPYLIWTLVFIIIEIFIEGANYTFPEILLNIFTIKYSQFFFVPLLIVYFLISQPLAFLAKSHWKVLIVIGIIVELTTILNSYLRFIEIQNYLINSFRSFIFGQFTEYFFFYIFGLIAGLHLTKLKNSLYKFRWLLLVSTIVFAFLAIAEEEWIFHNLGYQGWRSVTLSIPTFIYATSFILCYLSFDDVELPFSKYFYKLGVGTLGIYLVHRSLLLVLPKIIYHMIPFVLGYQIIYQPLLISIAIAIPFFMMNITKRSPFRKHYRILFG